SLDLYANGHTRPSTLVDTYGIVTSFRHNVYRSWFFYEAIPELYWPRDEEGHYSAETRFTLRFEIQFWQN
ncbi:MAG: hypothetical protein FD130_2372, partial [Halothiobacillaceae bacterium]